MISAGYLFDWFDQFWLEQSPKNVMEFPQEIECAASMEDSPVKCLPYSWGYSSSVVASGRKFNKHFHTALYNLLDEVSPPPNPFSHTHALSEGNLNCATCNCMHYDATHSGVHAWTRVLTKVDMTMEYWACDVKGMVTQALTGSWWSLESWCQMCHTQWIYLALLQLQLCSIIAAPGHCLTSCFPCT